VNGRLAPVFLFSFGKTQIPASSFIEQRIELRHKPASQAVFHTLGIALACIARPRGAFGAFPCK
jgi:hypothetical protein